MKKFGIFFGILLSLYFFLILCLWAFQDNLIFHPRETTDPRWTALIERLHGDYVSIRADDGAVLEGIFLSNKNGDPKPTIIVFEGNAILVEEIIDEFTRFPEKGFNVLLMDYRGYGLSTGVPDLAAMEKDAEKIFDAAASHPQVQKDHIIAWGISLGTGIATHLASVRPVEKVVLMSPMESIAAMGFRDFPIIPPPLIRLLLNHDTNAIALAPSIHQPVLVLHGTEDFTVPFSHGEAVANAWGGEAHFYPFEGRRHNDLWSAPGFWEAVDEFVGTEEK